MKTIKSVLIGALVALLGVSSWAALVDQVEIRMTQAEGGLNTTNVVTGIEASKLADWTVWATDEDVIEVVKADGKITFNVKDQDGESKVYVTDPEGNTTIYTVSVVTVDIKKTITNFDDTGRTATVSVVSHILSGKQQKTANVLFIGSRCSSHYNRMVNSLETALNTIANKANVDYFIYAGNTSAELVANDELKKGDTVTKSLGTASGNNHAVMKSFYDKLYQVAKADEKSGERKYDYVVLEFDGSRLGASQNNTFQQTYAYQAEGVTVTIDGEEISTATRDETVAKYLQNFYRAGQVIWIVDADSTNCAKTAGNDWPYTNKAFRPVQASNLDGASSHSYAEFIQEKSFKGLMGLLNPEIYLDWENQKDKIEKRTPSIDVQVGYRNNEAVRERTALMIGHPITKGLGREDIADSIEPQHWTTYNNAAAVADLLNALIPDFKYDIDVVDNINTNVLTVKASRLWTSDTKKDADDNWGTPILGGAPITDHTVTGSVDKVGEEFWLKMEIDIEDTNGTFLVPDESKDWITKKEGEEGRYLADPNASAADFGKPGPVCEIVYKSGTSTVVAEVEEMTDTKSLWEFLQPSLRKITAESVEILYDGTPTNVINVKVYEDEAGKKPVEGCTLLYKGPEDTEWKSDFGIIDVTNQAWIAVAAEKAGYMSVTNDKAAYVTINPRKIYVNGVDTNKVYGASDPDPLPYVYDLSNVVKGEEDDIKDLLDASARTASAEGKKMFGRKLGEDVNGDFGYTITNETPFNAGINYTVAYNPAKMTIDKDELKVEEPPEGTRPEGWATPFDYIGIYDAVGHTISFKIDPAVAAKDSTKWTQVRFSKDEGETWTDWTDYIDEFGAVYANGLMFTNCCNAVKVCVEAKNYPNYIETNLFGYVTITQRVVTVTADSKSKIYGDNDPDLTASWDRGLGSADEIGEYDIVSNALAKCAAAKDPTNNMGLGREKGEDAGEYDITNAVPYKVEIDGVSNYRVEFVEGTFTINGGELAFVDGSVGGYTNKYDAAGHGITFGVDPATADDIEGQSHTTQVRFSTDEKSSWTEWADYNPDVTQIEGYPKFTNCNEYTVWVQASNAWRTVGFIETNATVVITQRVITVTATAAKKTYGKNDPAFAWDWDGDYVAEEKSWIESQLGSKTEGIKRIAAGGGDQDRAGLYKNALSSNVTFSAGQNYIVEFVPADFTIEPGQLKLTVAKYEGVYDGNGHTIDLQINVTNDATSRICIRTSTDNANWSEWTPWPDGDVKDILPMATNVADSMTVYVQATNEWPRTLAVALEPTYTKDSVGNYKPTSANAAVTITKRPVTLTAPTKTCKHDKIPEGGLTFEMNEIDISPKPATAKAGMVVGEEFEITIDPSSVVTEPGKSAIATFTIDDSGTALKGNYEATIVPGRLEVFAPPSECSGICCEDVETKQEEGGCTLYNVKFSFKSLGLKPAKCSQLGLVGGVCSDTGVAADEAERIAYLDNATRTFEGILWQCEKACVDLSPALFRDGSLKFALWEKKSELSIAPKAVRRTVNREYEWDAGEAARQEHQKFSFLARYGQTANRVGAFWTPTISSELPDVKIYAAGFGSGTFKKGAANGLVKSINGNAVAMLEPMPLSKSTVTKQICAEDVVNKTYYVPVMADICTAWTSWCCCNCEKRCTVVPASGTWSVKYNASASKNGRLSKIIPSYAWKAE